MDRGGEQVMISTISFAYSHRYAQIFFVLLLSKSRNKSTSEDPELELAKTLSKFPILLSCQPHERQGPGHQQFPNKKEMCQRKQKLQEVRMTTQQHQVTAKPSGLMPDGEIRIFMIIWEGACAIHSIEVL